MTHGTWTCLRCGCEYAYGGGKGDDDDCPAWGCGNALTVLDWTSDKEIEDETTSAD